jgi:membrane protease YdiL (CAAX protease family)
MSLGTRLAALFVSGGRLRSGWRVTAYLLGYLLLVLATQVPIVTLYVALLVLDGTTDAAALMDALQPARLPLWLHLALKTAEMVVLLPLTYVLARWVDVRRFVSLGLRLDRTALFDLLLGLALSGGQMVSIFLLSWAAGWLDVSALAPTSALLQGLANAVLGAVLFTLVAVGEELTFRGYVQVNLGEGLPPLPTLVLTALLFGLFHALNPNASWLGLVNIALAGLAIGYGRTVTGALWLPIGYHLGWNYVQGAILALPVSGVRYGGLLAVVDPGRVPWLTGGAFGPEGGLLGTLALLSCFPVYWWWGRQRARDTQ